MILLLLVFTGQSFPQFILSYPTSYEQSSISTRGTSEIFSTGYYSANIFRSTNSGDLWTSIKTPAAFSRLYPFSNKTIYATSDQSLYLSTDNGSTWVLRSKPGVGIIKGLYFKDDGKIIAFGDGYYSKMCVSVDSGATFTKIFLPSAEYALCMFFSDANNGFAGCRAGRILKTTDGGASWVLITTGITSNIQSIHFVDNLSGWAVSNDGYLLNTSDRGNTWTNRQLQTGDTFSGLKFFDSQNGLVCGSNFILKTTDGGTTWIRFPAGFPDYIFTSAAFTSKTTGWVAGYGIYKFDLIAPSISINFPKFGELWLSGTAKNISFNKYLVQGTVTLSLSTDAGSSWKDLAANIPIDSSSVTVTAPFLNSNQCVLKAVVNAIPSVENVTQGYFVIGVNPPVTTTSPNQITQWLINDGRTSYNPSGSGIAGFIWPAGTTKTPIFEDGVLWAGNINGELRLGGSTYRSGLQPGPITSFEKAADPTNPLFGLWKVKKNWQLLAQGIEREIYAYNASHWPGNLGAPYEDVNHNGSFTPGIDAPKYIGDETCWYVANDLDPSLTNFLYGTKPIGLETQVTVFGFNTSALKDVIFKKVKLINKGKNNVSEMYISIWSDPDLGASGDDFIGCDTVLNLGYVYNGRPADGDGTGGSYGTPPPAAGYQMLQTPIVAGTSSDSAFSGGLYIKNKKNVPMNSFIDFIKGIPEWDDPALGDSIGARQMYNYMLGRSRTGAALVNPVTNLPTRFMLPGNPVTATGWYEGAGWPNGFAPGDRRFIISFGPFNFAPGDTQEIVYATLIAKGNSNIESITALKNLCRVVKNETQYIFADMIDKPYLPTDFILYQNYPNPFNPNTTISYELPTESTVKIVIYNMLGQTVREVQSGQQSLGKKFKTFNANGLSSGIYFYSITAKSLDGKREYHNIKKMVVLK